MAKNFDLTSPQWLEMVFKGKNREYGAYEMRRNSSNRHIWAMLITLLFVAGMMFLPGLIKSAISAPNAGIEYASIEVVMTAIPDEPEEAKPVDPVEMTPPPPLLKPTIQFTPPIIARNEDVRDEDRMATQIELSNTDLAISIVTNLDGVADGIDPIELTTNTTIANTAPGKKEPLGFVEQMPQPPGGEAELYRWLSENLIYPTIAAERGVQGTVVVRFVVTETGSIGEIQLVRGVDRDLDREAMRVVGKLPKFIPGRQNGQAVPVWFTLPVKFSLRTN